MSTDQIKTAIAVRLINYRNENNLTQKQMAAMIGKKKKAYAKYEERLSTPPLHTINVIAQLLSISMYELINEG